ncbi:MAG: helix-turn-helix transcriptional regulator [Patescibacteria group bacterium]
MSFSKEIMKGIAETVVLKALDDLGEAYGYQLGEAIAKNSQQIFNFPQGTIYPLLYRLEIKGYVKSREKTVASGKIRRYYRLTASGQKALGEQVEELNRVQVGLKGTLSYQYE